MHFQVRQPQYTFSIITNYKALLQILIGCARKPKDRETWKRMIKAFSSEFQFAHAKTKIIFQGNLSNLISADGDAPVRMMTQHFEN